MSEASPQLGFYVINEYLKDLSFENPMGPGALTRNRVPSLSVSGSVGTEPLADERRHRVSTTLTAAGRRGGKTVLLTELTYVAEVELENVPDLVRPQVLHVDVPTYLLPKMNAIMDHATRAGGFLGFQAVAVDFRKAFLASAAAAASRPPATVP